MTIRCFIPIFKHTRFSRCSSSKGIIDEFIRCFTSLCFIRTCFFLGLGTWWLKSNVTVLFALTRRFLKLFIRFCHSIELLIGDRKQWMSKCIFPIHSIFLFNFQTFLNKIFAVFRDIVIKWYWSSHDIVKELKLVIGRPRSKTVYHLVED